MHDPPDGSWVFDSGAGVTTNGSPGLSAGVPASPYGQQVGFLQKYGSMSQSLSGFQAGVSYTLTVAAAQRAGAAGGQTFRALLDGNSLGTVTPGGGGYQDYSLPAFTTSAGAHTLTLAGLDPQGGDHTAFIDNVRLSAAPAGGTPTTHSYGYDLAGNRKAYDAGLSDGGADSFDAADKDTTSNSANTPMFSYDGDGNTTQWNPGPPPPQEGRALPGGLVGRLGLLPDNAFYQSGGAGTSVNSYYTFTWDDLNRLVECDGPTLPKTNGGYDARGLRVWSSSTSGVKTFYVYDGGTLLGEVAADPSTSPTTVAVTAAYTWGAAGLVSERRMAQGGGIPDRSLWYHFGPQGETRQLTDANGNVADTYSYTAYGVSAGQTGNDANPFRYGGRFGYYCVDASSADSLYLCGLRWYDASLGRFLSRDPIGYHGGDNLYAYCQNDPVKLV